MGRFSIPQVCSLLLAVAIALSSTATSAEPADVKVDEFLFPTEGALEANLAALWQEVEATGSATAQALYGIQLLSTGDHVGARQHCSEAYARGLLFEAAYCMSMVTYAAGELEEAERLARQAVSLRSGSVSAYIVLANIKRTLKDKEGMVAAVELGLKAIPDRAPFWEWELAKMFESLGDLDAALQCVGVLSRITAQDPLVFTQAGDWLRAKKRLPEAAQMYRFALTKASWYQPAAIALMGTLREDGQWGQISRLTPTLLENPQLRPIYDTVESYQAEANQKLLELESAAVESRYGVLLNELHTFDEIEPSLASKALLEAAQARIRYGKAVAALELVKLALNYDPSLVDGYFVLADVYFRVGRLEEAEEAVRQGLALEPDARAYVQAAKIARRRMDGEGCINYLKGALEFQRDDVEALLEAALCLRMQRYEEKEREALLEAHRVDPEDTDVLRELVQFYLHHESGNEDASRYLQKLVALLPYDYRICGKLGGLLLADDRKAEALAVMARCYTAVPPHLEGLREQTLEEARTVARKVRDEDKVIAALDSLCDAGAEGACTDLAAFFKQKRKSRGLKAAGYRLRVRKPLVGELERLGPGGADFLVLGLEAPGFDELPLRDKTFLYYMSRAAIAGDELLYLQNHRHALKLKRLFETLFDYRQYLPKETAEGVHDFLKFVWVNHGNYDHRSGVKFVPARLTRQQLKDALALLYERGEGFDFVPGKGPEEKFSYLERTIFDADFENHLTVTEKGKDIVAASAVNHYDPGLTEAMIDGLDKAQRNALAVRFAQVGGKIVPQYFNVNGLGADHLKRVVHFLRTAIQYSGSPEQRRSLEALIRFYETGDEEAFREHSVAWLKTRGTTDFINGFVEQLKDPRGVIGNFEGMAAFVSDAELVDRLADEAAYFEKAMPWPDQFKRDKVDRPVSNVASVLVGTGDMGPVPWAGYNLPNYADIRSEIGAKNVIFLNIMTARSQKDAAAGLQEFYLPEVRPLVEKWGQLATNWNVYMHEIIGHGSGKPDPSISDDPRNLIGRSFSALEEARADLVALYFIADPKLVEIGAIPKDSQDDVVLASYAHYFQGFLSLYRRFHGGTIKEAHWKGRQLILQYLLQGGEGGEADYGLRLEKVDGKYFVRIVDPIKVRAGVGTLLRRVQVIKSLAQKDQAEALIDRFGSTYDEAVAENIAGRSRNIGASKQTAFVFPRLEAQRNRKGEITDVRIRHDEDLTAQQLRFRRLQQTTDDE